MDMMNRIKQLKEEKNAVILAHYYVNADVQAAADFIGDSFYLAKKAAETDADKIVFAGVEFMGESTCRLSNGSYGDYRKDQRNEGKV